MGVYQQGTPVVITETFKLGDVPTDPTAVSFKVESESTGTLTTYTVPNAAIAHPSPGVYILTIDTTALLAGVYRYQAFGSGAVTAVSAVGEFELIASLPTAVPPVGGPTLGPCQSWITGADVARCCSSAGVGSDTYQLDEIAVAASMSLYEISGRQFSGVCERTVRPCRDACSCWPDDDSSSIGRAEAMWAWSWTGVWRDECTGRTCGCSRLHTVKLAGYPVRRILEVKIDGQVVDPTTYRLDRYRELVRLDAAGPPVVKGTWPNCQNLALADSEQGTFSVKYHWGVDPPPLGRIAAAELACQLYLACPGNGGANCDLPSGVTRIQREGITVERNTLQNWLDRKKGTGLDNVDLFIATYNPQRAQRPPAVFSPDVQRFARPA